MSESVNHTQKGFFSGVLLLTLSTVSVKIIGLIYKIPMLAYLGSEGMGYFNSAYEIYALFCVISTAGFPVALSVLISDALAKEETGAVERIYRAALAVFVAIGVAGSAIMLLFAKRFCGLIQSDGAFWSILSISPTVLLICLSSALRGFFQGHRQMLQTAISQVIEAVGKLLFGLWFASAAIRQGYQTPVVAAYAGLGLTLGTALSLVYLWIEKARFSRQKSQKTLFLPSYRRVWHSLAALAIPMTLGVSLVGVTKLVDMTMVLRRLQAIGYTEQLANKAYGSYTTLALSVFALLPTLLNSISLPLVPSLCGAIAQGDMEKQAQLIRICYRLTAVFAIPAALVISAFARPILLLLFGYDAEAVSIASPLLSYLGVSVFLSCMITATNAVLHSYKIVNRPIFAMLAGAVIKIVSAYFLIGNPGIGLLGAPMSTFLCNLTIVMLNLAFVARFCDVNALLRYFLRPLLAATGAVGVGFFIYVLGVARVGEGMLLTLLSLATVAVSYLLLACLTGAIRSADVQAMPMGGYLNQILVRLRLIRQEEQL